MKEQLTTEQENLIIESYREDTKEKLPVQTQIKDHMHWSQAVRNGLLYCSICGEQIEQGCYTNNDGDIICDNCEER